MPNHFQETKQSFHHAPLHFFTYHSFSIIDTMDRPIALQASFQELKHGIQATRTWFA